MHRPPRQKSPELEALLDERDHVLIQISLAKEASKADPDRLQTLINKLAQTEAEITRRESPANE